MIKFAKGDILKANVEALVNTVNTVGIMGKGLALLIKKAFPEVFEKYRAAALNGDIQIGKMHVVPTGRLYPVYVINFPTKEHWKGSSEYAFIERGLDDLVSIIKNLNIQSIAIPPLGSGNGRLEWAKVKVLIIRKLETLSRSIEIIVFEPGYNDQVVETKKQLELTPVRAMLLYLLNRYRVLGYEINLLVVQKIVWFLQRLGEPMKATFEKGHFGPYSHEIMHLLNHLNGNFVKFDQGSTKPDTTVQLNEHRLNEVEDFYKNGLSPEQKLRIKITLDLIEGFESPYGLELLATVDFIRFKSPKIEVGEIEREISEWTDRKREIMKNQHIRAAFVRLTERMPVSK